MSFDAQFGLCVEPECTPRCRSKQHARCIMAALTRGTEDQIAAYLSYLCQNCAHAVDDMGHTSLHLAASCGKRRVVEWLLQRFELGLNGKDLESGYTPLHRSLFYGQIHVARSLISLGASLATQDHEGLAPLDHLMKDLPPIVEFNARDPCEVYVWGSNANYNLGLESHHNNKVIPEVLDCFKKDGRNVTQVAMDKFHSVFVCRGGRAYSCGHGQGGRLGNGGEKASIAPQLVALGREHCTQAAVGVDHSAFLTTSGAVLTCGMNQYHQLGHSPPPQHLLSPKPIASLRVKGMAPMVGVCAARFHTAMWSQDALYTCGLNAGQLGHRKSGEATLVVPKMVAALAHKENPIAQVATSDGAMVVATKKGEVFILHDYRCQKLYSNKMDIQKVEIVGGHLDHTVKAGCINEKGGSELCVLVLTKSNKMFVWQESDPQLNRCMLSLTRQVTVTDLVMHRAGILVVTKDGEAFQGTLQHRKKEKAAIDTKKEKGFGGVIKVSASASLMDFVDRDQCEVIKVKRLPHIHRAIAAASDPKGRNFAVIQSDPKLALLEVPQVGPSIMEDQLETLLSEVHECDAIHDVVFQVGNRIYPAHRYIVACSSPQLNKVIADALMASEEEDDKTVRIEGIFPDIFEQLLKFMYTGTCDLLKIGKCTVNLPTADNKEVEAEVGRRKPRGRRGSAGGNNPLRAAYEAAKALGLDRMAHNLDQVRYCDGWIKEKAGAQLQLDAIQFNRDEFPELHDAFICSEDDQEISAHRCILVARLEYFHSMFGCGWVESDASRVLHLPFSKDIIIALLDYLYKDHSSNVAASEDIYWVGKVLVVADQFLIGRLKEACEQTLAELITLKNAPELLQFAATYSCDQLKACCMQYICLNLATMLESRSLDVLEIGLVEELGRCYREFNPVMSARMITPYSERPGFEELQAVCERFPVDMEAEPVGKKQKPKKKPQSRAVEKKRHESVGSVGSMVDLLEEEPVSPTLSPISPVSSPSTRPVSEPITIMKKRPIMCSSPPQPVMTQLTKVENVIGQQLCDLDHFPDLSNSLSQKPKPLPKPAQKPGGSSPSSFSLGDFIKADKNKAKRPTAVVQSPPKPNPWAKAVASDVTFTDIVADQKHEEETLEWNKAKPLAMTQLEDQAIEELLRFYNADNSVDEHITVTRVVSAKVAAPVWCISGRSNNSL